MKIRRFLLALLLFPATISIAFADKGMWLLNELTQQSIDRMRELGFTMPMDQLYSLDQPSLANAVVIFGGGCTGITVSQKGLIFTNHHCGFDAIQSQSSVDHDYLRDGFVSQTLAQELPIAGLKVKYLKKMIDVTDRINDAVKGINDEMLRLETIEKLSQTMAEEYENNEFVEVEVTPFYAGNKYYVVVYDVFADVRMVMAPPSSVGKFGGDTDNWMWPRHTGDFSVFRVYADANNKPAAYSAANKPYKPVAYAKVSLNGYKPGDFAMTIGFPGSTQRYLTSWGVQDVVNNENAPRAEIRGIKQAIWKEAMEADQATRIKYASKYASSSNYWKNSIGMNRGIAKLNVVERKAAEEKAFTDWYTQNGTQAQYAHLLSELKKQYQEIAEVNKRFTYLLETLWTGAEVPRLANSVHALSKYIGKDEERAESIRKRMNDAYKDYTPELDRKVLPVMLDALRKHGGEKLLPELYKTIDKKFKGSAVRYADNLFKKSFVPYSSEVDKVLAMPADKRTKKIEKDPAVILYQQVFGAIMALHEEMGTNGAGIEKNKRELFAAQQRMNPKKPMPSDANFTMRMSYGTVGGYVPQDGAFFGYYTTEQGVFEKQDPTSSEFAVQPELLSLFRSKDFGRYGVDGKLRLCFLSDNDITGGNSGSPVFDKNGDLIGLAFDGNWEAMSGDIEFEPALQRTINVDIRYVLFMIDKWAKCPRLVEELTFVEMPPAASACGEEVSAGCCKEKSAKAGCPKVSAGCCKEKSAKAGCPKDSKAACVKKASCDKAAKAGCPKDSKATCAKKASCDKACKATCEAERQEKLRSISSGCKCPKGTASCKGCKEGKPCGCSKKAA